MEGAWETCKGRLKELDKNVSDMNMNLAKIETDSKRRLSAVGDTATAAMSQCNALEARLEEFENERKASARANGQAFEALSTRLTELGVELVELPTVVDARFDHVEREMFAGLSQINAVMATMPSGAELDAALRKLEGVAASAASSEAVIALEKDVQDCRREVEEAHEFIRRQFLEIHDLEAALWGDATTGTGASLPEPCGAVGINSTKQDGFADGVQLVTPTGGTLGRSMATPSTAAPQSPAPVVEECRQSPGILQRLAYDGHARSSSLSGRLTGIELLMQELVKSSAAAQDVQRLEEFVKRHTHDRLVSVDGSVVFGI